MIFMVRKQIKFKKRKCEKEKTAQESIPEFLKHLAFVRFDFVQPILEDRRRSQMSGKRKSSKLHMDDL